MTPNSPVHSETPQPGQIPVAPPAPARNSVFFGLNGLRAGWRLLIFIVIVTILGRAIGSIPPLRHLLRSLGTKGAITPAELLLSEALSLTVLVIGAAIMARIEKRSFAHYGLPMNRAFGKLFWLGLPLGFVGLSVLLAAIAALHGFSLEGLAVSQGLALKYALLYALGFFLVGFFEEFSFRGYLQSTLGSGIGFWPAAIILAICFGALHLGNPGEAKFGAIMAGSFGLLAAFSLFRTGTIWFAIGMHAAWDWGETFFYGVPDSGLLARGHLLNSSFHGANWLTGGSVGPEGSLLVFPVLLLMALVIHLMFPARRANP